MLLRSETRAGFLCDSAAGNQELVWGNTWRGGARLMGAWEGRAAVLHWMRPETSGLP